MASALCFAVLEVEQPTGLFNPAYAPRSQIGFLLRKCCRFLEEQQHSSSLRGRLLRCSTNSATFVRNAMTLREALAAQLAFQADWTCEARLASAFAPSALARASLAVTSNNAISIKAIQTYLCPIGADPFGYGFVGRLKLKLNIGCPKGSVPIGHPFSVF